MNYLLINENRDLSILMAMSIFPGLHVNGQFAEIALSIINGNVNSAKESISMAPAILLHMSDHLNFIDLNETS